MSKKLSFSIAVNFLTENFKKGANTVKNSLRSIQLQVITFAAALGAGGLGLSGLLTRFKDVARETSRMLTALKNVSGGTAGFVTNLRFVNDMAAKYGLEINALTGNFAKFTASAMQANMPMEKQQKVFESLSRASTAFGLSAEDTNGVFIALSQMMGKGKISSEELRKQMGERIPIAMQAMAKAANASMAGLEKLLKQGKLLSADVIPKFADALSEMIPDVDTDNIETSLNRLSNTFNEIVNSSGFQSKYKALIDGLNDGLKAASQNIQNIVVGVMAAIAFVATNAATKTLKGWGAIAAELTTDHQKLNAELVKATTSRLAAENALETARLKHSVAIGNARIKLAQDVAYKEKLFTQAVVAEDKARIVLETATGGKRINLITKGFNTLKVGAAKLAVSIKSMWNTFAPAIIISGLIAIGGYLKNLYDKTKSLERITGDYNTEVEKERTNINILFNQLKSAKEGTEKYNKAKTEILNKYGDYLQGLSDEIKSLKDVEGAYKAISAAAIQAAKDKAIARGTDEATEDYLKVYKRNASALKKQLEQEFGKESGASIFDSVVDQLSASGQLDKETKAIIDSLTKTYEVARGTAGSVETFTANNAIMAIDQITAAKNRLDKQIEEITSIFGTASSAETTSKTITTPTPTGDAPDDKALRAAEKRMEALRKLDEEDRRRQIEKQKFDLDLQQKTIDLMDDSFEKRIRQMLLNLDKENIEIEEFQNNLLKQQTEHLKTAYVGTRGSDIGFGEYFKSLQQSDFKDSQGISILPEGLTPEDIERQVDTLLSAAQSAQSKGLSNIEKESENFINRERLRFASNLNQRLADIRQHYDDELILAKGSAEATALLLENRARETEAVILESIGRQLEFEMQYNQKVKELLSDRYFFESDKRKAAIEQEIADQAKLVANIEKQVLNDPNNEELVRDLQNARIQLQLLGRELKKIKREKLGEIFSDASEALSSIRSMLDDFGVDLSEKANNILDGYGQILDAAESIDITKPFTLVTGTIKTIGGYGKIIANLFGFKTDYEGYNKLKEKYDALLKTWDELITKKKEYLSASTAAEANRVMDETLALMDKQAEAIRTLAQARLKSGASAGSHSMAYRMWEGSYKFDGTNWRDVAEEISAALGVPFTKMEDMLNMTGEQLQWIKENYSGLWTHMDNDFTGYLEQLIQYGDQAIEVISIAKEQLTGITFDSLKDSFLNTLADMDSEAADFADDFSGYLQKAILRAMLDKTYAKRLEDWYDSFADASSEDGINTTEFDKLQTEWNNIVNDALADRNNLKDLFGWNSSADTSQSASSGGFQSMDQDTGNRLDGRFAALQMSGVRIEGLLSTLTISTGNLFNKSGFIGDELQRQTSIFNEMKKIQLNGFYEIEGTKAALAVIADQLERINLNTSKI